MAEAILTPHAGVDPRHGRRRRSLARRESGASGGHDPLTGSPIARRMLRRDQRRARTHPPSAGVSSTMRRPVSLDSLASFLLIAIVLGFILFMLLT